LQTLTFAAVGHDAVPVILQPRFWQAFRSALVSLPEPDLQYWHELPDPHVKQNPESALTCCRNTIERENTRAVENRMIFSCNKPPYDN
jgi:hypothetical protein